MATPNDQRNVPVIHEVAGNGGLQKLVIQSSLASAEIYLHGAHVTTFQPTGQAPVLWMSARSQFQPDKPIRGGVPICFPWFGPRAEDPKAPVHGFARLRDWKIDSITADASGIVKVVLSLESDAATKAIWPADFHARHVISIGSTLTMTLEVTNRSSASARFEEALHTYLTVGDISELRVTGLGGTRYVDKVGTLQNREQSDPVIRFTGETDRVYLDTQATVVAEDPVLRRKIEVSKSGSNATVVWNPWISKAKAMPDFGDDEWRGMVCIETVNANKNAIELAAGATHSMTATVRVI